MVRSNRTGTGRVIARKEYDELGYVAADTLNPQKSRILLMLALTRKGASREEAYRLVQRNAMPVWRGEGDFRTLLTKDTQVRRYLSEKEIAATQGVYNWTEKDRYGLDDRSRILLTVKDGKYVPAM